jgi:hypothetical protein
MKKGKIKTSDMEDAYICECGEIRPLNDPNFPWNLIMKIGNVPLEQCHSCGKTMEVVRGSWQYYDVKKGIWPFRKKERHWLFDSKAVRI